MVKSILSKILLAAGIILLICFLGGLVPLYHSYYTVTIHSYGSTPLSVYVIIHAVVFLVPSILCFLISLALRSKSENMH